MNEKLRKVKKRILIFLLHTLLIGNIISWFFGAWPTDLPHIPYSPDEIEAVADITAIVTSGKASGEDYLALGVLRFLHNDTDLAHEALERAAVALDTEARALSYLYANQAKLAGQMLDPFMGIRKLFRLREALQGLASAKNTAPSNLAVRVNYVATLSALDGRLGTAHEARVAADNLVADLQKELWIQAPASLRAAARLSCARVYAAIAHEANPQEQQTFVSSAQEQWSKFTALDVHEPWLEADAKTVASMIDSHDHL